MTPSAGFTKDDRQPAATHPVQERPELLLVCAVIGIVGIFAPILLMGVANLFATHDLIADTISDLARGPHKWIMDLGFYLSAAGLLALSIAAAHAHIGRVGWSTGIFVLALIALVIVLLGLWDRLNTAPSDPERMTTHTRLTFALGPLYLAGPLLMARGMARVSRRSAWAFVAAAGLWAVLIAAYQLAPDSYDGLLEKAAFAATTLWTAPLAWMFLRRARRATVE